MKIQTQEDLKQAADRGLKTLYPGKIKISVGMATCGIASGADKVFRAFEEEIANSGLDAELNRTGCIGYCQQEPLVDITVPGKPKLTYSKMNPDKVKELVEGLQNGNGFKKEWVTYRTDEEEILITGEKKRFGEGPANGYGDVKEFSEHPFFAKQKRIIMRNCGLIEPSRIDEYIARGGYLALHKVLNEMSPEQVIEQVKVSQIRGRGGAGFLTYRKWANCRKSQSDIKYVICNADEGDPGAFMDRSVLEGDPLTIIEGMTIGAYALGAKEGYIYVRAEYPLAIQRLKHAIKQAEEYGLLGEKIFGTELDFKLNIAEGAGAFVCGESTALIASIEGRAGEPRPRPPRTTVKGLWGKPTNINNVKTWASIPPIMYQGGEWYASIGNEKNTGTTVFALVGSIKNNGLVEVPLGTKLEEIIFDMGGGLPKGKEFKAVQTGGPSGGCVPKSLLDLPVDYEKLTEAGSMMGSGGMIVLDEDTCIVQIAKFFLDFTADESCGKCTPCREGTQKMLKILNRITEGKALPDDVERLVKLSQFIADTSLCGLGGSAPNPVLSTIRYFRDEYDAHVKDKWCPAAQCRDLVRFRILENICNGCTVCVKVCPVDAISGELKKPHDIAQDLCTHCRACYEACKFDAIKAEPAHSVQGGVRT